MKHPFLRALSCSLLFMSSSFVLCGCNGVGDKETLAIRVENESIYEEDIGLLQKLIRADRNTPQFKEGVASIVTETAVMLKAKKEFPFLDEMYKARGSSIEDRLLAYVYQQFYTVECLQIPESDLRTYYYKHKNEFDSTKTFLEVRNDVAKTVYLQRHKDELDAFAADLLKKADKPASASVAYVVTDSASAVEAQRKWVSGEPLRSVPGFFRTTVMEGLAEGLFKQPDIYAMFFSNNPLDVGRVGVRKLETASDSFAVVKLLSLTPKVIPDTAKIMADAGVKFVNDNLSVIFKTKFEDLVKKHNVQEETINPPRLEEYYEAHKNDFLNAPMMDVYGLESSDSLELAKLVSGGVLTLDYFKQNGVHLGNVKSDHCLPYGFGMVPALFDEMGSKPDSTVSSITRSVSGDKFFVFYVASHTPALPKPFERTKSAVLDAVLNSGSFDLDSDYVLISVNGVPAVRERDILQIYAEDDNLVKSNRTRTRLVKSLMQSVTFAAEARELKLDRSWEFKSLKRQDYTSFINSRFKKLAFVDSSVTDDSLAALYAKIGNPLRPGVPFEESRTDLYDMLAFPENLVKHEYYRFTKENEGKTIDDVRPEIFRQNAVDFRRNRWSRYLNDLLKNTNFTFYDNTLEMPTDYKTPESWMALADSLSQAQNAAGALENWTNLRDWYAENDSIYAKATLEIARIASEIDQFETAETEYDIFCRMWPDSPEVEKAMFSRGFILNENLHRDDIALEVLQDFQKKFPKSSLKESVDWLVNNIKSNGKLADDLIKKISAEE